MFQTESERDFFVHLKHVEGASSGSIAVETGMDREEIKEHMRVFERMGYGEYTIFDGMYHFWFNQAGNEVYYSMKHEGEI